MENEFIEFPRCYRQGFSYARSCGLSLPSWKNKPTRQSVRCAQAAWLYPVILATKSHLTELCCDPLTGKLLINDKYEGGWYVLRLIRITIDTYGPFYGNVIACITVSPFSQIAKSVVHKNAVRKMRNPRSMTRLRRDKTTAQDRQRCILSIIMSQRNVYSSAADLAIFFRRRCDGGTADTAYVYDEPGWPAVQHHVVDGRETDSGQTERRWYIGVVGPDRRRRRRYRRNQQRHTDKRLSAVFQHPDDK